MALEVQELTAEEVELAVDRLEKKHIREKHSEVKRIFIEAEAISRKMK